MRTAKTVRRIAWIQLLVGLFLAIFSGFKIGDVVDMRDREDRFILVFLAAITLLGLQNLIAGIWHLRSGRLSKWYLISGGILVVLLFSSMYALNQVL
jgi:hypothetical protein